MSAHRLDCLPYGLVICERDIKDCPGKIDEVVVVAHAFGSLLVGLSLLLREWNFQWMCQSLCHVTHHNHDHKASRE